MLAPARDAAAQVLPSADEPLPAIDDNFIREDDTYEVIDGVRYELFPAKEPHATQHFDLPRVLGNCLAPEYKGTADMLTRPDKPSNFAPDVSILPKARDPKTNGRQVEEIAIEVQDTSSWTRLTEKAKKLVKRGVRRVLVVDVIDRSVHEWDNKKGWQRLAPNAQIVDRCFVTPISVRALLDELLADETVVRGMIARDSPAMLNVLKEREDRGRQDGQLAVLRRLFERRLARDLTLLERGVLIARVQRLGAEKLSDLVLDATGEQLAAWLATP
jgi:Uma2 family endonuclease